MALLNPKRSGWLCAIGVALTLGSLYYAATPPAAAARPIVGTHAVHAAFTVNLTRFITWPEAAFESRTAPLVIGTFPRDPVNAELDAAVAGETVAGRPLQTIRIQSLNDLAKCHAVFVSKSVGRHGVVVERVSGRPVLTISDAEGFLELGGHVRFVPQPPHTRLRISPENLKSSHLESRAQLLRLAGTP